MAAAPPRQVVLVVDDSSAFRALVRERLERARFDVLEAGDADEALATVDDQPPALVVLDVKLPRVSGYELLHELRDRLGQELPIIFVSGERVDTYDRIAGLLLGADDYLVKPFDPDELLARVRRSLRSRRHGGGGSNAALADRVRHLTAREREILYLLAAGQTSAQIADELVISPRTLGTHIQHVLAKLGATTRVQAVAFVHQAGVFGELAADQSRLGS